MLPFQTYLLRRYFDVTGWDQDALFSNLTRSSTAILDFSIPTSFHFTYSHAPVPGFYNSLEAVALPTLVGSLAYFATSRDLALGSSEKVDLSKLADGFKVWDMPKRPEIDEIWQGGRRVDVRDYLMFGRCNFPSWRVDGLYTSRLSRSTQSLVAFVHVPTPSSAPNSFSSSSSPGPGPTPSSPTPAVKSSLLFSIQHNQGHTSTEYSYSAHDGLFGLRSLYNFQPSSPASSSWTTEDVHSEVGKNRVDEEEALFPGLRGRFSVGGEVYLSMKQKSGGISLAGRFCTIPDVLLPPPFLPGTQSSGLTVDAITAPTPFLQPPMTLTMILNPLIGHSSTSMSSKIGRDLAVSSRFDFNIYSYESDWTVGGEWKLKKRTEDADVEAGNIKLEDGIGLEREREKESAVLKMRASTTGDVSLLYMSRVSNLLFSVGVSSDFRSSLRPVRGIGLEVQYFS